MSDNRIKPVLVLNQICVCADMQSTIQNQLCILLQTNKLEKQ